ncbi:MAG: translesion error-prone DNA polymerase V autoproteolytic subunit [Bacteroidia bacterium]
MKVLSTTSAGKVNLSGALSFAGTYIPAGFPSPAADYEEDRIDMNELLIKHPSSTFFIKVEGKSMINAFIPNKALLVVDKSITAKNNDIVVAVINGEFTVKKFVINKKGYWLMPANDDYKPIEISEEMNFLIWGVVTKIIIDPKDVL